MSRIYGNSLPLNYDSIERFFRERSSKLAETGPLSVTMYQTEEVAKQRDDHEKAVVAPLLQAGPATRVLDIGCGTGRWGELLCQTVASYLGVDFCDVYVEAGRAMFAERALNPKHFGFQQLRATEVDAQSLQFPPPFDVVIIAGLLAFLNDEDAGTIFCTLPSLLAPGAVIYVREPIALKDRLTLLDFPSEQLQQSYSAVYRTDAQMREIFKPLTDSGAVLATDFALFPPDMLSAETRQETSQRVYVYKMATD